MYFMACMHIVIHMECSLRCLGLCSFDISLWGTFLLLNVTFSYLTSHFEERPEEKYRGKKKATIVSTLKRDSTHKSKKYPDFDISLLRLIARFAQYPCPGQEQVVLEEACGHGFSGYLFLKIGESMIYLITNFSTFFTENRHIIIPHIPYARSSIPCNVRALIDHLFILFRSFLCVEIIYYLLPSSWC